MYYGTLPQVHQSKAKNTTGNTRAIYKNAHACTIEISSDNKRLTLTNTEQLIMIEPLIDLLATSYSSSPS